MKRIKKGDELQFVEDESSRIGVLQLTQPASTLRSRYIEAENLLEDLQEDDRQLWINKLRDRLGQTREPDPVYIWRPRPLGMPAQN
jgi:hypothetical protein